MLHSRVTLKIISKELVMTITTNRVEFKRKSLTNSMALHIWSLWGRQVAVESLDAGQNLDLTKVDGTWMLQYTTASDVVSILQASKFPFLKVSHSPFARNIPLDSRAFRYFLKCHWSTPEKQLQLLFEPRLKSFCCWLTTFENITKTGAFGEMKNEL